MSMLAPAQPGTPKFEEIKAQALQEVVGMDLRELRRSLGKTQLEMAEATGLTQPELSRMERRLDYRLSTLRRYVEALGGHLEVTAVVGDKRVTATSRFASTSRCSTS
jgi:predicted transcriptional regulator